MRISTIARHHTCFSLSQAVSDQTSLNNMFNLTLFTMHFVCLLSLRARQAGLACQAPRMALIIIFVFLFSNPKTVSAQSSFLPKNLGANVNSSYDDINPVIMPSGRTLFFVRANHPENTFGARDSEDIWYSDQINDSTWSPASRIPSLNIGRYNAILAVAADGQSLLLNGVYNKRGNIWKKRGLSVSYRRANKWMTPERLKVKGFSKENEGMRSSGSLSADGNFIVLSYSKKFNGERNDLFVCRKKRNDKWRAPKKIGRINTRANEEAPFLSIDGKTLFFASNRKNRKQYDIYKSVRSDASNWKRRAWSKPVPLSDTINTEGWESYFKTTAKGSWAYFSSTNKSLGRADIYRVKLFEENPFVIVSGTVVNANTKLPLWDKDFVILVDGKPVDSLKINKDSATYTLKLPLGKSYSLKPTLANFTPIESTLDVSKIKEFTKSKVMLQATPLPYVLVKGKLLIKGTGLPISASFNARVLVNNVPVDSLKLDLDNATYEVKLPYGTTYQIRAEATKHESAARKLNLMGIEEYREITHDLVLTEEVMAIVVGKILDKKTNKPLSKLSTARINVEGMTQVIAKIDTLTGNYELKLPLASTYTINAAAPNYYPMYEIIQTGAVKTDVKIYKDLLIAPIEVGQSIRLNNIFFDPAKAVLKPASFPELDRVVDFLGSTPDLKIEIGGHTDNVGKAATNQKLSLNRAQAVANYLIKKGIPKERVVAKGYGLSKPVASNKTKDGKAQNRRVEFTVLDK
jgi:outer membrane protein OmpA-like peptidoglycan-associated protein/Tol biopolymer transport system component